MMIDPGLYSMTTVRFTCISFGLSCIVKRWVESPVVQSQPAAVPFIEGDDGEVQHSLDYVVVIQIV